MRLYGLIGYPVEHSFSEAYFTEKLKAEGVEDAVYRKFLLRTGSDIVRFIEENPDLAGFNITMPHKQTIIPMLAEIDEAARIIGAVNCVKVTGQGLKGYNTDAPGFRDSLSGFLDGQRPAALVLGTGGASKAVRFALEELSIEYTTVSRNGGNGLLKYTDITPEIINRHRLIINATPLGSNSYQDLAPDLPYESVDRDHWFYDLSYNPPKTLFLAKGEARGAKIKNGHEMFVRQAELSWKIWHT